MPLSFFSSSFLFLGALKGERNKRERGTDTIPIEGHAGMKVRFLCDLRASVEEVDSDDGMFPFRILRKEQKINRQRGRKKMSIANKRQWQMFYATCCGRQ